MTRRIAVIGIHGVGEHLPGATARAITQQLQHTNPKRYEGFHETALSIPVETAPLGPLTVAPAPGSPLGLIGWFLPIFRRGGVGFHSVFKKTHAAAPSKLRTPQTPPLDVEFSRSLLDGGRDYQSVYTTIKLAGIRDPRAPNPTEVDVHELYWSDLSHVVGGSLAIVEQLFQLLIHMASLGRTAAATVLASQHPPRKAWHLFYLLNAASYWLLSMPIVTGNLILVMFGGLLVPAVLPSGALIWCIAGLAGVIATAGVMLDWLLKRERTASDPSSSAWLVVGAIALGVAIGLAAYGVFQNLGTQGKTGISYQRLGLAALTMVPLYALCDRLMRRYDIARDGAHVLWRTIGRLVLLWMLGVAIGLIGWRTDLIASGSGEYASLILHWLGHSVEFPFTLLLVAWLLLYLSSILSWLCGLCLSLCASEGELTEIRTARLAMSLPAPFFLGVVLSAWAFALVELTPSHSKSLLPDIEPFTPWLTLLSLKPLTAGEFIQALIDKSGNFFIVYVVVLLIAAVLLIVATLPSAFLELFPLARTQARTPERATALGDWLNHGFGAAGWAGALAALGFVAILPVGAVASFFPEWLQWLPFLPSEAGSVVGIVGLVAGGTALTFAIATQLIAKGFSNAAGALRVPLDTALDVDNWLRERPVGETVRLKIFARFACLLRQLQQGKYDGIVIVAHSQGTIVASEFLRYLCYFGDPILKAGLPSFRLLTMGSPLRQLYAKRFNALYDWAHTKQLAAFATPPELPEPHIRVVKWANAYGSGDYIGRAIWNDEDDRWQPSDYPPPTKVPARPDEFCVGAAAHTHYFDEDNLAIGKCIDTLIR